MNTQPITAEEIRELMDYDPETGICRWKVRRGSSNIGGEVGHITSEGYRATKINRKFYKVHNLIWLYVYGKFPDGVIDHKNRIRDDNTLENLRDVTRAANNQNAKPKKNKTGFFGVALKGEKFTAAIRILKKTIYLGIFNTPEEAHAAYIEAKLKYHEGYIPN